MAKAAKQVKAKPKKSVKGKKSNAKSGLRTPRLFPKDTLEAALRIATAIKAKNGGNPWSPSEVAKAVELSAKGMGFYYLSASSRDYGLTNGTRDSSSIMLTEFGRSLVYAPSKEDEDRLKMSAFLKVDVLKRVLAHFKGPDLPEMTYLANTLTTKFGLDPKLHAEFYSLFTRNCRYLNLSSGVTPQFSPIEGDPTNKDDKATSTQTIRTLVRANKKNALSLFVVMPFREREKGRAPGFFEEVLNSLIVPAGKEAGFNVATANKSGSDIIQATIVNDLLDADMILADLTEHNPNVLFELGLRMAEDKPVALMRAKGTAPIFDVDNMLRVCEYDPNLWPSTIEQDLPKLIDHVEAAWKNRDSNQTYMKILRSRFANNEK
jgi:hypothetical protein